MAPNLLAIAIFVSGAKGHSALQLSRDLDVQYKTAFVLSHKLREAIAAEAASIDGSASCLRLRVKNEFFEACSSTFDFS